MNKTLIYVSLVILAVIAFGVWLKCNPSPLPPQKVSVDSTVYKKYQADTADLHWMLRNSQAAYTVTYRQKDSLQAIVNQDEARLGTRAVTINSLVAQVHHYEATRDTTALLDIIDSLTDEVEQGIADVRGYEVQNHTLDSAYRSVISIDSVIKQTLGTEVVDCNNFAFALQLDVQRLRSDSAILSNSLVKSKKATKISILINAILAGIIILKK